MSHHTSALAHALPLCLLFAGAAPLARAQPLSSANATPGIILAQQIPRDHGRRISGCDRWDTIIDQRGHRKIFCRDVCYRDDQTCRPVPAPR
jgi:hypothetical protein